MAVAEQRVEDVVYDGVEGTDHLYLGTYELMGTWEVARYLGIEKSRIARWLDDNAAGKSSIAEPVARLKSGPFWTLTQIKAKARSMYEAELRSDPASHPSFADADVERWLEERRVRRART